MATTAAPGERILTLDILRGVAVMGILAMNIVGFAMPDGAYMNPRAYGGHMGADLVAWAFNFVFVDGKMRGLFSLLFGASLLLVVDRAAAKGENAGRIHYRRMWWLLLFGLVHLYFIWPNDILHHYALIGMIAYAFRNKPVASLVKWAIGLIAISFALMALLALLYATTAAAAAAPDAGAEIRAAWNEMKAGFGPAPAAMLAQDLALHGGGYGALAADRLSEWYVPLNLLFLAGPETLGYMLLGMAGLKTGLLIGDWDPSRTRRWMIRCYGIAIPPMLLLAWLCIASGFDTVTMVIFGFAGPAPFRPVMIIAHAALILLLIRQGGALAARIAAAGRAAFSNYLASSIVMTTLFYGYGFGLYGNVGRAELYLFVIGGWALMLLWSKPWLDRFHYGPLEWLWRTLARGRVQPMRRRA